jgi:chemotaxis protein CheZ
MTMAAANQDSDELEALFDSIVAENSAKERAAAASAPALDPGGDRAGEMLSRLGSLTRNLHESLRELGFEKSIAEAASGLPDARKRLEYIATMTEKAAVRTLSAAETAQPLQQKLEAGAKALHAQWEQLYRDELSVEQFKALASSTRSFLAEVPVHAQATHAQLVEIMMAQDFQDLTGQVIKKITEVATRLEQQMLELLIDYVPPERKEQLEASGLAGPVIDGTGRDDVVTSQTQVDDLLASLGF